MNQIYFIFILFSLLFIIESKAINILLAFVGLIITSAILIGTNNNILSINGEYISYILILVQVSALTILFGFIIMLYPKLSLIENIKFPKYFIILFGLLGFLYLFLDSFNLIFPADIIDYTKNLSIRENIANTILTSDTEFLRKLGTSFYMDNNNIIKLILLTIILLLAIIILFFLVSF